MRVGSKCRWAAAYAPSLLKKQVVNALAHHTGPVVSVKKIAPAQILSDVPGASQTNPPDGAHHNNPQPKDDE